MFYHKINPVLLDVGIFELRWYGLFWFVSALVLYFWGKFFVVRKGLLSQRELDDIFLFALLGLVIGARLAYVLIYNLPYYISSPFEIFAVWKGGFSFHGGAVGLLLAGFVWCKFKGKSFLALADSFTIPFAFANGLVRIGNFINGELYGRPTQLPWGVNFGGELDAAGNPIFRHPSQLYEAGYDFLIMAVLFAIQGIKLKAGFRTGLWLLLYAALRSLTEFVRQPEIQLGPLTMGQLLNIPIAFLGLFLLLRKA